MDHGWWQELGILTKERIVAAHVKEYSSGGQIHTNTI